MAINLLPPAYRPKPLFGIKSFLRVFMIGIIIFFICFLSYSYYLFRKDLKDSIATLEQNIEASLPMIERIENFEMRLNNAYMLQDIVNRIGRSKQVWSDILSDIAACLEEDIWFAEINKFDNDIIIKGRAKKIASPGEYALKLRGLKWFSQVDLTYSTQIGTDTSGSETETADSEIGATSGVEERLITINENVDFLIRAQLKEEIIMTLMEEKNEDGIEEDLMTEEKFEFQVE